MDTTTTSTAEKFGKTFAYILLFVVALVGNSFIAMIVCRTKTLRKPINFFIVNMAMSDLMFPIFLFPLELSELYVGSWLVSGPLGQALCKLVPFLANVSTAVSIQSLVLIAVDRFEAVVFPLRSPLINKKLCPFFILSTWIVAMAVYSPYLFASKLVQSQGQLYCDMQWNETFGESSSQASYFLAIIVVFHYIPMALLIVLYSIILIKLKSQKIPGEKSFNAEKQRASTNRNVLKMAIAIVLGFALCWSPLNIITLRIMYIAWDNRLYYYAYIARFIASSNSAVNPCICFTFNRNYRRGLKNLLKYSYALRKRALKNRIASSS